MTLYKLYDLVNYLFFDTDTSSKAQVYLWVGGGDGQVSPIFPADDIITDTINGEEVVVIKV